MPATFIVEWEGKSHTFKTKTRNIVGRIMESALRWRKQKQADNLSYAGFDPELIVTELRKMDDEPVDFGADVLPFMSNADGMDTCLKLHLAADEDPACIDEMPEDVKADTLQKCWNDEIKFGPAPAPEKEAEASPLSNRPTFGPTNPPSNGPSTSPPAA